MSNTPLTKLDTKGLLQLYAAVMEELRTRGVVRSSNNPVADYTERLVAERLGLERTGNSVAGHDAVDRSGRRYQIKGRRITAHNRSTQLSALRDLDHIPFEYLVGVVYREDFSVDYAGLVPYEVVLETSSFVARTNSHRFMMRRSVLADPRVTDVTAKLAV